MILTVICLLSTFDRSFGSFHYSSPYVHDDMVLREGVSIRTFSHHAVIVYTGSTTRIAETMHAVYCSGTLIEGGERVLTSASCVRNKYPETLKIYFLMQNLTDDPRKHEYLADRIIMHPAFDRHDQFLHDIAVIFLKQPVDRRVAKPALLPSEDSEIEPQQYYMGGYRFEPNFLGGKGGDFVIALAKKVSDAVCGLTLGFKPTKWNKYTKYMFCARGVSSESSSIVAPGDIGAGLVVSSLPYRENSYEIYGVASGRVLFKRVETSAQGVEAFDLDPTKPSVFTRISSHLKFIDQPDTYVYVPSKHCPML